MDPSSPNEEPQNKFSQQDLLNQVKSWWKTVACVLAVVLTFAFLTGPSKAQKKEVEHVMEQVRELVIDGFRKNMRKGGKDPDPALAFVLSCIVNSEEIYAISVDKCPKDFQKKYSEFINALKVADDQWGEWAIYEENRLNRKSVERKEELLTLARARGYVASEAWISIVYFSSKKYDLDPTRFDQYCM